MLNNNKQEIQNGSGNQQAGHDIINTYNIINKQRMPLIFHEKDIKNVIVYFSEVVEDIAPSADSLTAIPLSEKNEINKLSEEYFEIIVEENMEHFKKIDVFLRDVKNKKYKEMYLNTASELRKRIAINRENYNHFEEIFLELYEYVFNKNEEEIESNKEMIWVFLHYMYCNCQIGKKHKG